MVDIEKKPSYFWIEKINEILEQYKDKDALIEFSNMRKALLTAAKNVEIRDVVALNHVQRILICCERAIRDTIEDKHFAPNENFQMKKVVVMDEHGQPVVDEKGKVQYKEELSFKISPDPKGAEKEETHDGE